MSSPEREREHLHTGSEELDLELAIGPDCPLPEAASNWRILVSDSS